MSAAVVVVPRVLCDTRGRRPSPLASRIAVIVADIDGKARVLRFIESCRLEGEARGIQLLDVGTVLR